MKLLLGLSLFIGFTSFAYANPTERIVAESCTNCRALVTLPYRDVAKLIQLARVNAVLPLDGKLLEVDSTFPFTSTVEIFSIQSYADANGLDSFDVAKRVRQLTSATRMQIESIEARVELP